MPVVIVPARPVLDATGTPYSPAYEDVYHSADGGPGQARHVFLGGNDLPARWSGARLFTILETGFGLGVNFLATWQAWRDDPARPQRLHYVSIEKHPLLREDLGALLARYDALAPLAAALTRAWPLPLPGLHRLELDDGRVNLTLAFGDAAQLLPRLRLAADACYLDGFSPERNPDMWSATLLRAITRLARPGTTLATYTAARAVREALSAAGWTPTLRPGFGRKRHMLAARLTRAPRGAVEAAAPANERRALVVGAGLAGAATAERLAARGWHVELIERQSAPAMETSAIPAGVVHPQLSRDDNVLSRLTRAGFLCLRAECEALAPSADAEAWRFAGVLQVAKDARDEARMAETARTLGYPDDYARYLGRDAACECAGVPVRAGGWWFPGSGWLRPPALVAAWLARARPQLTLHAGRHVHRLQRDPAGRWLALAEDGAVIAAAPVCVLANAHDAARLLPLGARLRAVRGQLTRIRAPALAGLDAVLAGTGHVIALRPDDVFVGATYDHDDARIEASAEAHAANLARLAQLVPSAATPGSASVVDGAVGFRCVAPDRLPLVGAAPDVETGVRRALPPGRQPREAGLYVACAYGSRGLTWAALAGELIASLAEGEPLPVESDLADAIDPARFLLRRARRAR